MKTLHVFNRAAICRRAHALARTAREETARRAYEASAGVVCGKINYPRPFAAVLAATPLDLSSAMRQAWAEARREQLPAGALVIVRQGGALAPLRRIPSIRVWPLVVSVARFLDRHFIPSRAA